MSIVVGNTAEFLESAAAASRSRCTRSQRLRGEARLLDDIAAMPAPPALKRHATGFDVIAEYKKHSPSAGRIETAGTHLENRVRAYAAGGAVAVSVLCEPDFFDGNLDDLHAAAAALDDISVPVMCKDFLVDPYQLVEARAAGAGGVLLIARILDDAVLHDMVDVALDLGLFVLLECFDAADIARAAAIKLSPNILVGINCRDLSSLQVDASRFAQFAPANSESIVAVAESGIDSSAALCGVANSGYEFALLGSAMMRNSQPGALLKTWLRDARATLQRRSA